MPRKEDEHGTSTRYKKHIRDKDEEIDQACRDAHSAAMREYYKVNPDQKVTLLRRNKAAGRAHRRLKKAFLVEWETFYMEELKKEGLG